MSTIALLVLLLLVIVVLLLAAGVAYVVHRHPSWVQPFAAAFAAVMVMATLIGLILTAMPRIPLRLPARSLDWAWIPRPAVHRRWQVRLLVQQSADGREQLFLSCHFLHLHVRT